MSYFGVLESKDFGKAEQAHVYAAYLEETAKSVD